MWRPFERRSSDAPRVAASGRPLQISAWLPENPVRQFRCHARRRDVLPRWPRHAPPRGANPRPRFLRRAPSPRSAPAHSSTRVHCPANRISRLPPSPRASAAPSARAAPRAFAEKYPPAARCPPCGPAAAANQWSPRAAGKTNPHETLRRESPPANCGASR